MRCDAKRWIRFARGGAEVRVGWYISPREFRRVESRKSFFEVAGFWFPRNSVGQSFFFWHAIKTKSSSINNIGILLVSRRSSISLGDATRRSRRALWLTHDGFFDSGKEIKKTTCRTNSHFDARRTGGINQSATFSYYSLVLLPMLLYSTTSSNMIFQWT